MKNFRLFSLILALVTSGFPAIAADKAPALPIDQALKIAQDHLQKAGVDRAIVGLILERSTLHSTYWYAKWSSPIEDGPKKETGLRIDMDGSVTRFVTAPGGGYEPPVGQRPVGARSMR